MKINLSLVTMAAAMLLTTGCVSTKKFDNLQANYNSLQDTNNQLTRDDEQCKDNLGRATVQISSLQERINAEQQHVTDLQSTLDKCLATTGQGNTNISKLIDQIKSSNQYIQELNASRSKSDSLNMVLTNNLTRSLSKDELQDVNVKVLKGVVYISLSDSMLYKSGSYDISDRAGDHGTYYGCDSRCGIFSILLIELRQFL